ncbi:hypothetical protein N0O92_11770 [Alkalihalobacillus sp. MEB130]|uniref:hypothetical protein n=1 Tax=Alkalihalobacillus sp. MEB130 TaxID=2976704 RepID=UPI0028DFBAB2|nr:hypothetical protein [Alkalihalobacillus sp. MEB130]MDT8860909.1 hypothetical protein [Alkalihalobacillus sp. MEB130]
MSDYQQFLTERENIDLLLEKGYEITNVTENLSGAFVDFSKGKKQEEVDFIQLHIKTADARKYFATKMMEKQNV